MKSTFVLILLSLLSLTVCDITREDIANMVTIFGNKIGKVINFSDKCFPNIENDLKELSDYIRASDTQGTVNKALTMGKEGNANCPVQQAYDIVLVLLRVVTESNIYENMSKEWKLLAIKIINLMNSRDATLSVVASVAGTSYKEVEKKVESTSTTDSGLKWWGVTGIVGTIVLGGTTLAFGFLAFRKNNLLGTANLDKLNV